MQRQHHPGSLAMSLGGACHPGIHLASIVPVHGCKQHSDYMMINTLLRKKDGYPSCISRFWNHCDVFLTP